MLLRVRSARTVAQSLSWQTTGIAVLKANIYVLRVHKASCVGTAAVKRGFQQHDQADAMGRAGRLRLLDLLFVVWRKRTTK